MTITITKSGPFYATAGTPISFSSLRTNFRATDIDETVSNDTSSISASQLRRIVSQSISDPTVPDATENEGISTENNLNISQFRNSVKYYRVSQTSTNTNLNISSQTWNSNLSKNIKKKVSIVGTIGSSDTNIPALLTTSGQHCNLEIVVTGTGKVIGAGGTAGIGGGTAGGNGGNGGTAMNLLNTLAASVIKVTIASGANIYGGGGGGGGGTVGGTGGTGGDGLADGGTTTTTIFTEDAGCNQANQIYRCDGNAQNRTNALANYINSGCTGGPNVSNTCGSPGPTSGHGRYSTTTTNNPDIATTGGAGGPGGNGANGGVGAGYEQALGAAGSGVVAVTDWTGRIGGTNAGTGGKGGKGGDSGAGGTFGANGSPGTQGDPGIIGGDGNVTGGSAGTAGGLPVGNGGTAGRAITGSNYSVTGTINSSTIKGSI